LHESLKQIAVVFSKEDIIFYASAFIQKSGELHKSISGEDMNGFMSALHGMKCDKGLVLILHTPGG